MSLRTRFHRRSTIAWGICMLPALCRSPWASSSPLQRRQHGSFSPTLSASCASTFPPWGGVSTARRLSVLCEFAGVQTAWHGPADVSPIGVAANSALSMTTSAFGIQEVHQFSDPVFEGFPGTLRVEAGHLRANQAPGWGIDLDERKAGRFPPARHRHNRCASTVQRPDVSFSAP